jgi:hypothetical protein
MILEALLLTTPTPAETAVAQTVPPAMLIAVIGGMFTLLVLLGTVLWKAFERKLDKMEGTLEKVKDSMPLYATKTEVEQMREQTRASMRSMGDGFDARVEKVSNRVAVLESDLAREIAVRDALGKNKGE